MRRESELHEAGQAAEESGARALGGGAVRVRVPVPLRSSDANGLRPP